MKHIILIEENCGFFVGLNVSPVIFDENVFEKDALQLNISWKPADLGGKFIQRSHIICELEAEYGYMMGT